MLVNKVPGIRECSVVIERLSESKRSYANVVGRPSQLSGRKTCSLENISSCGKNTPTAKHSFSSIKSLNLSNSQSQKKTANCKSCNKPFARLYTHLLRTCETPVTKVADIISYNILIFLFDDPKSPKQIVAMSI